jgi:hypothetical protein
MLVKEQMTEAEHLDIAQKYEFESKAYVVIMRIVAVLGVLLGTFVWLVEIWHNAHVIKEIEKTHVAVFAFISVIIFIVLISIIVYFATLWPLYIDYKNKIKIINTVIIVAKEELPNHNLYKLIINHKWKPILMVSEEDYHHFAIGDEINIEYGAQSKEFFNYF